MLTTKLACDKCGAVADGDRVDFIYANPKGCGHDLCSHHNHPTRPCPVCNPEGYKRSKDGT